MVKHAKKSKHSDVEESDSTSSDSVVEKRKATKHGRKGKESSSSSSSSGSASDSSTESVKRRKSIKSKELKKSDIRSSENRSKWDSPDRGGRASDKKRRSSAEQARSRQRERSYSRERERERREYRDKDNRPKRAPRDDMEERNYRSRNDSRDDRPRRNDEIDDRHRNVRGRSRENRNYRNDNVKEERAHGRANDRWQHRENPRRGRQDSTHFRNSRSLSPRRHVRRQQRSRSKDRGDGAHQVWGKKSEGGNRREEKEPQEREEPNFGLSGALMEDTNKVNGVVVKYSEPLEARRPKRRWRLYPFKGETALPVLHIHRQSCFLVGRERKVVDLAVDHPSCSKQHAALQYRLVPFTREDNSQGKRVRLYLIDLDSANGTFLNNKKIEPRKYYELFEKDVVKFGFSTREYVLLHENSQEDQEDDDVSIKKEEPED